MLTQARLDEMRAKFATFGGRDSLVKPMMMGGEKIGEQRQMKLSMLPTTALVGLGVANDEGEAEEFLLVLVESAVLAATLGTTDPRTAAVSLLQTGFYLGMATARHACDPGRHERQHEGRGQGGHGSPCVRLGAVATARWAG